MWLLFAVLTLVLSALNLYRAGKGKNYKPYMALALSCTALTDCAQYSMIGSWAAAEDVSAILDVAPLSAEILWIFTVIMILINSIPAFLDKN